jgi:hypothetical protein
MLCLISFCKNCGVLCTKKYHYLNSVYGVYLSCLYFRLFSLVTMEHLGLVIVLQICILEALSSNLSQDTGYTDWDFSYFSSVPAGKCQDSTSIRP